MHFVPVRRLVMRRHIQNSPHTRKSKPRISHRSVYKRHEFLCESLNDGDSCDSADKRAEHRRSSLLTNLILNMVAVKSKTVKEDESIEEVPEKKELDDFEQAKSYGKYFVTSNIERVLRRFNPVEKKTTAFRRLKYKMEFNRSALSDLNSSDLQQ